MLFQTQSPLRERAWLIPENRTEHVNKTQEEPGAGSSPSGDGLQSPECATCSPKSVSEKAKFWA